ncbi:MAG: hypothetical protein F6K30_17875, partial [Cyanothece sp. SIO2G6]|nr:hypothetical protein [Cyanothece sp. SIO2G6]
MTNKFRLLVYTTQQLSEPRVISKLWDLLSDSTVKAKRYDSQERAKLEFDISKAEHASQIYENDGLLFVKGEKDGFLGQFSQYRKGLSIWNIWLNLGAMQGRKQHKWLNWMCRLFNDLPALYCGGASLIEFNEKHAVVKEIPGGGRVSGTIGISTAEFYQYLPGLYWLNIFGSDLVNFFGEHKILNIEGVSSTLLKAGQVMFHLNDSVIPDDLS